MSKIIVHSFKINVCLKDLSCPCSLGQVMGGGGGLGHMVPRTDKCQGNVDTCRASSTGQVHSTAVKFKDMSQGTYED